MSEDFHGFHQSLRENFGFTTLTRSDPELEISDVEHGFLFVLEVCRSE
jgi:hypothetical protein